MDLKDWIKAFELVPTYLQHQRRVSHLYVICKLYKNKPCNPTTVINHEQIATMPHLHLRVVVDGVGVVVDGSDGGTGGPLATVENTIRTQK